MVSKLIERFLRRVSVRLRIVGGFLLVLILAGSIAPVALSNFNALVTRLEQFSNVDAKIERLLLQTSGRVSVSQLNLNRYIQDYVPSPYEALDDVDQALRGLQEAQALSTAAEQSETIGLVLQSLTDYREQINALQQARATGNEADITRLESKLQKLGNDIGIRLELLADSNVNQVTATNNQVLAEARRSLGLGVGLAVLAVILAIVFSILISSSVTRPLRELRVGTEAFQQGNMSALIEVSGADEFTVIARIFNSLVKQFGELIAGLEQRVSDRTKAMATSSEVSRRLSTILDQRELVNEVVHQVRAAFGYYHTQIYFFDEAQENLVMTGGTGEAGEQMLAQFHKIKKGRGLVGRAAETNQPILVADTASNPDWLPNVLLPDTKSEAAIPISIGDQVLGVLDVQHNLVNGLTSEAIDGLQSIANQVAVAVQNARSYTEIQRSQALLADALQIASLANWEFEVEKDQFTFNDQFYAIFRTTAEKVGGYKMSSADYARNFVHPEDQALVGAEIQRVLASKERHFSTDLEHRIIFADGGLGYIAVHIKVERDEAGKIIRWYGANQNVTERRRIEDLNRQRAVAQEKLNLITQKIQNTTTVSAALQVAARELGHALGKNTQAQLEISQPAEAVPFSPDGQS